MLSAVEGDLHPHGSNVQQQSLKTLVNSNEMAGKGEVAPSSQTIKRLHSHLQINGWIIQQFADSIAKHKVKWNGNSFSWVSSCFHLVPQMDLLYLFCLLFLFFLFPPSLLEGKYSSDVNNWEKILRVSCVLQSIQEE